jgi:starch phosphorylase
MELLEPFLPRTHIAYFSMEVALRHEIHTYAGGLGILAGDTVRSCADLEIPVVFVALVSHLGYFRQMIDVEGRQHESPDAWDASNWCSRLGAMVAVECEGRPVWIQPWLYIHTSSQEHSIPVLLLDTDLDQNAADDRSLTNNLYGGDALYRLKQEIVLGIGGVRLLHALGFEIDTYHLNEGHAALLGLELLRHWKTKYSSPSHNDATYDVHAVRKHCVFTTHTPVEAGHDCFSYALVQRCVPDFIDLPTLRSLGGEDALNMTRLALNLAGYVNGVARRHAETTQQMFPGYRIHSITNGVHAQTWVHPSFASLFDTAVPEWRHEPEALLRAVNLPDETICACHQSAKNDLISYVRASTGVELDPRLPVVGFARRMTGYKRPLLLFADVEALLDIAARQPFQIVLAGKAHPQDQDGKQAIAEINALICRMRGRLTCAFVPEYSMQVAKALVAGADVWLNTPLPPLEASGTSGMKAALNGVLNLSVLDGWWIEACMEGETGWSIGAPGDDPGQHASDLYSKLDRHVLRLYYEDPLRWRRMMKQAIAYIGSMFNSQRMMRRYASEAYLR